jgi:hypothetical protein
VPPSQVLYVLALSQRKQVHRSNDDGLELDAKRVDLLREAVRGLTRARLLTTGSRGFSNPARRGLGAGTTGGFYARLPAGDLASAAAPRRRVGRALAARRGGAGVEPTAYAIIPADAASRHCAPSTRTERFAGALVVPQEFARWTPRAIVAALTRSTR